MFNTKKTFVAATIAALFASSVFAMSGESDENSTVAAKIDGKFASNYIEIIREADGRYLDSRVIEAILGADAMHGIAGARGKLDHNNPFSFEVDDSIDGGNHGNSQCKIPSAFVDIHDSVARNFHNDTDFVARGFGTPIAEEALEIWNITVDGDGRGLPPLDVGMYIEEGGVLYTQFCAVCHGEFAEGAKGYLPLAGGAGLVTSDFADPSPTKTVSNFWPYAMTLFDYNRRAMPFWTPNAPHIGDAGYMGITGYILYMGYLAMDAEGTELSYDTFFNAEVLMNMNKFMPNQGNFFCDRRPVIHNERCMTDCPDAQVGDGTGNIHNFIEARRLPDGTPQYNVGQRLHEDMPGVGHAGM